MAIRPVRLEVENGIATLWALEEGGVGTVVLPDKRVKEGVHLEHAVRTSAYHANGKEKTDEELREELIALMKTKLAEEREPARPARRVIDLAKDLEI